MRILLVALVGVCGGYLAGFLLSMAAHVGLGTVVDDSSPVLIAFGLLPYLTALVGLVAAPVIDARQRPR